MEKQNRLGNKLLLNSALVFLIALIILNSVITSNFFSVNTLNNIITQIAPTILVSMGMTLVISTGGIDISVGSMMAVSGVIVASLMANYGIFVAMIIGIFAAILFGAINGFFVGVLRLQAMVVTLGSMLLLRGLAQVITEGRDIYFNQLGNSGQLLADLGNYKLFGTVPIQIIPIVLSIVIVWVIVNRSTLGRKIEATGDNMTAGEMTGLNVNKIIMIVYSLSAIFAMFAGVFQMARVSVASGSSLGQSAELDAIAAVAIGGTPLSGGKAQVLGTFIGALIMQLITLTVVMNNIPEQYAQILKAFILVLALYFQGKKER